MISWVLIAHIMVQGNLDTVLGKFITFDECQHAGEMLVQKSEKDKYFTPAFECISKD